MFFNPMTPNSLSGLGGLGGMGNTGLASLFPQGVGPAPTLPQIGQAMGGGAGGGAPRMAMPNMQSPQQSTMLQQLLGMDPQRLRQMLMGMGLGGALSGASAPGFFGGGPDDFGGGSAL